MDVTVVVIFSLVYLGMVLGEIPGLALVSAQFGSEILLCRDASARGAGRREWRAVGGIANGSGVRSHSRRLWGQVSPAPAVGSGLAAGACET